MISFTPCLNTSTIKPTPLLEKIKVASKAGFEAIEPWNDEVDDYIAKGGTVAELNQALGDAGLKVVSMIALHSWVDCDDSEFPTVLEECKRRMDQALSLGCPTIVASPPLGSIDYAKAGARFATLCSLGKTLGIKPSMEFLGFVGEVHTLKSALAITEASGVEHPVVVADVFHLIRGGGSLEDLLTIKGDQMSIFHINDIPAHPDPLTQTDADRVLPGEGIAELPRLFQIFKQIGYSGPLSLELFNPSLYALDPYDVVKRGLDYLTQLAGA